MGDDDAIKIARIETKIDGIHEALGELKQGLGARVEKHGSQITTLETEMETINTVTRWVFGSAVTAVVLAIVGLVLKK